MPTIRTWHSATASKPLLPPAAHPTKAQPGYESDDDGQGFVPEKYTGAANVNPYAYMQRQMSRQKTKLNPVQIRAHVLSLKPSDQDWFTTTMSVAFDFPKSSLPFPSIGVGEYSYDPLLKNIAWIQGHVYDDTEQNNKTILYGNMEPGQALDVCEAIHLPRNYVGSFQAQLLWGISSADIPSPNAPFSPAFFPGTWLYINWGAIYNHRPGLSKQDFIGWLTGSFPKEKGFLDTVADVFEPVVSAVGTGLSIAEKLAPLAKLVADAPYRGLRVRSRRKKPGRRPRRR